VVGWIGALAEVPAMPRSLALTAFVALPVLFASVPRPAVQTPDKPHQHANPLAVVVDARGETAFVALNGRASVAVVDLKAGKVLKEIAVDAGPYDLAATDDTVYVTCTDGDSLVLIDRAKLTVRTKLAVGQAPRGLFVDPKLQWVYVACHDEPALHVLDERSGKIHTAGVRGRPDRISGLQAKTSSAWVTFLSSAGGEYWRGGAIDWEGPLVDPGESLRPAQVTNARGLAASDAQPNLVIIAQRHRSSLPATQVAQGWVFVNCLLVSVNGGPAFINLALDEPQRGFADPADVVLSPDRTRYYVASAGTDMVVAVDTDRLLHSATRRRQAFRAQQAGIPVYDTAVNLPDDLAAAREFVVGRVQVQANPRRLALSGDGKVLVVSNHLADSLTLIDAATLKVIRHIDLGGPVPDAARRGEMLFNSAKLTFHQQFSCASCHPDGGSDGLNWDLPRDGVGNFLNTRALWGVKDTGPYGWHGTSATLADRAAGTLRTLHQHEPTEQEVSDLVAYLQSLKFPRPLPTRADEKDAVARGKAVFEGKGNCAKCHRGDTLQDGLTHDIGTRQSGDLKGTFDTPTLRGVARTAPYLHHGRATTLEEVFSQFNSEQRHGAAHALTAAEVKNLVQYLKSL
jgi:YVTN family beta-propeller protein